MRNVFICKLANGQFVGNLISNGSNRSFVPVQRESDACHFHTVDGAEELATYHGAQDFTVMPYELAD